MNDIIELAEVGSIHCRVDSGFNFADVIRQTGKDKTTTLSLLVHLGVLTCENEHGVLRIPNDIMKKNVVAYSH